MLTVVTSSPARPRDVRSWSAARRSAAASESSEGLGATTAGISAGSSGAAGAGISACTAGSSTGAATSAAGASISVDGAARLRLKVLRFVSASSCSPCWVDDAARRLRVSSRAAAAPVPGGVSANVIRYQLGSPAASDSSIAACKPGEGISNAGGEGSAGPASTGWNGPIASCTIPGSVAGSWASNHGTSPYDGTSAAGSGPSTGSSCGVVSNEGGS